jgi:hypothetical protein
MLIAAGVLLLLATTVLLRFNWNEKIYGPFFTILGVGLATALATILFGLHETKVESAFVTSMVFDIQNNEPAYVQVTEENHKLGMRLMELHFLKPFPFRLMPAGPPQDIEIKKPANDEERQSYCGEILQYYLLQSIQKLQQGRIERLTVTKTSFLTATPVPFKLSKITDYGHGALLPIVAGNRFSIGEQQERWWKSSSFPLPSGTVISLVHETASSASPEKFIVRLTKPHYFQIDVAVQIIGVTDIGVLPKGVVLQEGQKDENFRTYHAQIFTSATFDKLTAGSKETEEYKAWANWLFNNLEEQFKD